MSKHTKTEPTCNGDCGGTCSDCCLFICAVCRGAEGSLPTECPGERMDEATQDAVYAGRRDFVGGVWITKEAGE
jgi:hypothetical protein